jgi:pimeloyl-ACP methyl ester carboxylesterase
VAAVYSVVMPTAYAPIRPATAQRLPMRGLNHHLQTWGSPAQATAERPTLVMVHGWMDVGASFQFVVDALAALEGPVRHIVAPDWRGFGHSDSSGADSYWFPDYLGDLDALIDNLSPGQPVDLLGHSMGGNVVMSYAGVRPARIRRLINLEGFGLPAAPPEDAPQRMAKWLDELKQPASLRAYASLDEVVDRLLANNPRLARDKAEWLAPHWARQAADGRWHILGDPAHKRTNPVPYRVDEVLATWRAISAPLLWVEGGETRMADWWAGRYSRSEFGQRLRAVAQVQETLLPGAGHMLHHDQPQALAQLVANFLD